MKITLLAIGSRGDVQPQVALGMGLLRAGYSARLVAGNEFAEMANRTGLEFTPLGFPIQAQMEKYTNIFQFANSITDRVLDACRSPHDGVQSDTPDIIVGTILGVSGCQVARELGIPFFYALPTPGLRTRFFPDTMFPPLPLGGGYNLLTHRLAEGMLKRSYSYGRLLFEEPLPTYLFYFSPQVIPPPPDWGENAHVTGYWFLDWQAGWQPPEELLEFLSAGSPPVCVGFGSMTYADPKKLTRLVVNALENAGQRGILVAGWGGLAKADLPSSVMHIDSAPYDWLYPRVSAAVHHAGAGTTAEALRAGIPSVTVPFTLDQPFWGRRLAQLGVGTAPIPIQKLTVPLLAAAIQTALSDQAMRARAADLGEAIRKEDGVANAIRIIEGKGRNSLPAS